jgi:hypothetical protein
MKGTNYFLRRNGVTNNRKCRAKISLGTIGWIRKIDQFKDETITEL